MDRLFWGGASPLCSDLPCHDPVNTLSGDAFELQKKLKGGRVLSPFILGELGLGDAQEVGEFRLTRLETADLPDSPAKSLQVRFGAWRIWFICSHVGYIIVV